MQPLPIACDQLSCCHENFGAGILQESQQLILPFHFDKAGIAIWMFKVPDPVNKLIILIHDYAQSSAALKARSGHGLHLQTAFAIRSVIADILKRLLNRKQKLPR